MEFQTISHAGLRVSASGKELLCDPWLIGSAYWRSWWNYPPVPRALVDELRPDFIYLTHLHWDHFHAPSLRLFDPQIPVIVPYDRYGRMVRDLKAVGRKNIIELKNGERFEMAPDFALQSYHISPFVTDSAVIIEAEGQVLLNVNDAKFAGGPLNKILRRHPHIDFCFRSHSSANARNCYHYIDQDDELIDDNEHYVRSFFLFMDRVRPRYAIPFASNNCFLHADTFAFNKLAQSPVNVAEYFQHAKQSSNMQTEIKLMIPGDSWSSQSGFALQDHDYFSNREGQLAAYQARVQPTLDRQAATEAKANISLSAMQKFITTAKSKTPFFFMLALKNIEILIVARNATQTKGFAVNLPKASVREVEEEDFAAFDARIEFPAAILMQSIRMNMFGHSAISKRVQYYATPSAMPKLKRLVAIFDMLETEMLPLSGHLSRRAFAAMLPRWRELLLYINTVFEVLRGQSLPAIEQKFLKKH